MCPPSGSAHTRVRPYTGRALPAVILFNAQGGTGTILVFFLGPKLRLERDGQPGPMENLEKNQGTNGKSEREQMKSLALGMASAISQLLVDKGFGQKPIDIVEALAFAMFIIADTYSLAKPDKDRAREVIHGFYDDLQDFFVNKVIIGDHQVKDAAEIQSVSDQFHDLSRDRFAQFARAEERPESRVLRSQVP